MIPMHVIYSRRFRFALVTLPKCGSSTLSLWFATLHGRQPEGHVQRWVQDRYSLAVVEKESPEQAQKILATVPVFAFVRDPWSRLVSAFVDKFVAHAPRGAAEQIANELGADLTFRQFVEASARIVDHHWQPLRELVGDVPIDAAWRLADLDGKLTKMERFMRARGLRSRLQSMAYRADGDELVADRTVTDLRRDGAPDYVHFYDASLASAVGERYADDLAAWPFLEEHA